MRRYIALIHGTEAGAHGVSFPDFPGCLAVERDPERAVNAAARALRLHVEGMVEERLAIPEPRSPAQVRSDSELAADLAHARLVYIPLVARDWNDRIAIEPVEPVLPTSARPASPATGGPVVQRRAPKPVALPVTLLGRRGGRVLARRIVDQE